MVLELDVTNIDIVFGKSDFLLVVAVCVFVEFNEVDFGVTKVVFLVSVGVADLEVHGVVSNWEVPFAVGIIAPLGLVSTVDGDGGVPFLTIVSESHVNNGVHLVTDVAGVDFEVC